MILVIDTTLDSRRLMETTNRNSNWRWSWIFLPFDHRKIWSVAKKSKNNKSVGLDHCFHEKFQINIFFSFQNNIDVLVMNFRLVFFIWKFFYAFLMMISFSWFWGRIHQHFGAKQKYSSSFVLRLRSLFCTFQLHQHKYA